MGCDGTGRVAIRSGRVLVSPTERSERVSSENRRGGARRSGGSTKQGPTPLASEARFRQLDQYRVDREWARYEGTPQRDLYRTLRERFLRRHADRDGWALDVGAGPGRFTPLVGLAPERRTVIDLSRVAISALPDHWPPDAGGLPHRVRGNSRRPPFSPRSFETVVLLGHSIGFAGVAAPNLLEAAAGLLSDGGTLVAEFSSGGGERSAYLGRLPPGAVGRLLAAPVEALRPRIDREGFEVPADAEPPGPGFRRFSPQEVSELLRAAGIEPFDTTAVAPLLGADPERTAAAAQNPRGWSHLLELEEEYGRRTVRGARASALLVAGRRVRQKRVVK